ncbi:hypothetical protein B6N60_01931 [Richelia sinica FACHB-800]|uniref:2'-5' RNA ligase n=1 Tax=Richelia sinica FACHB-800 TaxID=1357546 RepID=A0A975T6W5_9NOST|nr:2'-5' RNA ligase family protein [Richelia sinica]QXE23242.1 hypothetical protein B6N60_01931 [Richelia sinica FACHB-800]
MKNRFFIAILPPAPIQVYANEIKQYFADKYSSRGAQKSPPHITLYPPFAWLDADVSVLETTLREFAQTQQPFVINLKGFAAFPPRVIYLNVERSQELLRMQAALMAYLETRLGLVDPVSQQRPFVPHMTVAFRDLSKQNFHAAWPEFQNRQVEFTFTASHLTLLLHDGQRWNVKTDFPCVGV